MIRGTRHPVAYFFEPESVAVIGASRTPGKAGHQQVLNLQRGYPGRVYPINPRAEEVCGLPCFPSLDRVPGSVDFAIILLPARDVPAAVAACVEKGVPAVMIESAGFAEAGPEGRKLQDELVALARGSATRLWGPNCNGLVNAPLSLLASFIDIPVIKRGPVAFVAQTGIFAAALLNQMMEIDGFGVSKVATLGNKCDVSETDVLEYLASDDETEVIALHVEGLHDGARFVGLCRELSREKPILALRAGRTAAGARASLSHTGRLAGDSRVASGAFAQAGLLPAADFLELIDLARAFTIWGRAATRGSAPAERVAVLTTTGGAGVVAVDHAVQAGLRPASFSASTEDRLSRMAPLTPGASNPVDVWPGMERHGTNVAAREMTEAVLADPGVDAVFLILGAFSGGDDLDPSMLGEVIARSGKCAAGWLYGPQRFLGGWARRFEAAGIPIFRDLRTAAAALAAREAYARRRRTPPPVLPPSPAEALVEASRRLVARARERGARLLTEPEARQLLGLWGIRSPREVVARDPDEAAAAATRIGFPVAIKAVSPDVAHKSDVGAVALSVQSPEAVREAARRVSAAVESSAPGARIEGVLVQEMIAGGREVIAGVSHTPNYGPAVMFGLGGILVEAIGAVAFRLPPLDGAEVDRMIEESGAALLLGARRGRPPGDLAGLRSALLALAALAGAGLGLAQVEINPLMVLDEGQGAVAVDALVVLGDEEHVRDL
jgi:acetyltransferase